VYLYYASLKIGDAYDCGARATDFTFHLTIGNWYANANSQLILGVFRERLTVLSTTAQSEFNSQICVPNSWKKTALSKGRRLIPPLARGGSASADAANYTQRERLLHGCRRLIELFQYQPVAD
jgi:hypothetical protein